MDYTKLKTIIVDDVETVRLVFKKSLQEIGVESVQSAGGIQEAWDIIKNQAAKGSAIDVVFCDWNMPTGDGIELLKLIRKSDNSIINKLKFVMITGNDAKVTLAMDFGANNIIHKPFDASIIQSKFDLMYSHLSNRFGKTEGAF